MNNNEKLLRHQKKKKNGLAMEHLIIMRKKRKEKGTSLKKKAKTASSINGEVGRQNMVRGKIIYVMFSKAEKYGKQAPMTKGAREKARITDLVGLVEIVTHAM